MQCAFFAKRFSDAPLKISCACSDKSSFSHIVAAPCGASASERRERISLPLPDASVMKFAQPENRLEKYLNAGEKIDLLYSEKSILIPKKTSGKRYFFP